MTCCTWRVYRKGFCGSPRAFIGGYWWGKFYWLCWKHGRGLTNRRGWTFGNPFVTGTSAWRILHPRTKRERRIAKFLKNEAIPDEPRLPFPVPTVSHSPDRQDTLDRFR
jgi:hypothetical protein